jgi:hypothetical protein
MLFGAGDAPDVLFRECLAAQRPLESLAETAEEEGCEPFGMN